MQFAMADTNMETVYNCKQLPNFNFKSKNAKKYAICNRKPENGNFLHL